MPTTKAAKTKLTYTFSEAAEQVGCSSKTISRMVASRQIRTVLLGKTPRIPAGELERIGARK
jgi:excisionase family DNA binding protein